MTQLLRIIIHIMYVCMLSFGITNYEMIDLTSVDLISDISVYALKYSLPPPTSDSESSLCRPPSSHRWPVLQSRTRTYPFAFYIQLPWCIPSTPYPAIYPYIQQSERGRHCILKQTMPTNHIRSTWSSDSLVLNTTCFGSCEGGEKCNISEAGIRKTAR